MSGSAPAAGGLVRVAGAVTKVRARRCAPRNRWELGWDGGKGWGQGTRGWGREGEPGDANLTAMWQEGWAAGCVCGCPPVILVLDVKDLKKKKKRGGVWRKSSLCI